MSAFAASRFTGAGLGCVRGERIVFQGLSFEVAGGTALTLIGPNGAGKSSLLRLMAGLLAPAAGKLLWNGAPVADDPDAHRARLRWLGHGDGIKPGLSALENAAFWAALAGAPGEAALGALQRMGLGPLAETPARFLSQGQRRRLALTRLLLGGAALWLLDEPTVGLDAGSVAVVEALLADHCRAGGMVVLATHVPIAVPAGQVLELTPAAVPPPSHSPSPSP
ncbi:cytochrome c biogenesis ATP-binding export protein CcmA [Allostella vacuolata]|nr:cytochrome c biogenesis ATP-binding export protein CcmA [Stella vacuolata]